MSWAPTLLDSELTKLPRQPWLWVSMASDGGDAGSGNVNVAFVQDMHKPEVLGVAGLQRSLFEVSRGSL